MMNANPNSLIIYIPICNEEEIKFLDEFEFKTLSSYGFDSFFKIIKKFSLLKMVPINRSEKKLKPYLHKTILPNKVNISLDFFHIMSKIKEKQGNFYFFRIEIYSSNTKVNFFKFINYYYDNKNNILNFLLELFKLGELKSNIWFKLVQKLVEKIHFIYFNIIFFGPIEDIKKRNLKNIYFTEEQIIDNDRYDIYSDLQGRLTLYFNNRISHRSGKNLKIIGLRAFLLRFFTWLYQKGYEKFEFLLFDIFNFTDYLISKTRYLRIYRRFIKLRNYSLAYGDYQFNDDHINFLNESKKTWDKLTQFLNMELDLNSLPKEVFKHENDFNEYIYNKLKIKIPNIRLHRQRAGGHIDLSVGNQVAIQVKKIESKTPYEELTGQIQEDLRVFGINYGIAYGIDNTKTQKYIRFNTHKIGTSSNIIYIIKSYP